MKYKFFYDRKCTSWERTNFEVEDISEETARLKAIAIAKEGLLTDNAWEETLYDTCEVMSPEENDNQPTIELYQEDKNDLVWDNTIVTIEN